MLSTVSFLITRLPELGDRRAWEVFEIRYTPVLKRYFRKSGCADHIAADLAQETIRRVAEGLSGGAYRRDKGKLRNWIGGIGRNVLRNYQRKTGERPTPLRTELLASQEDPSAREALEEAEKAFDAVWVRSRVSALIRKAAESFDTRDLRCYFLVEIRKLPVKTVAQRLGLSEASVFNKRRAVANWLLDVGPRFISTWEQ